MQKRARDLSRQAAADGAALPEAYHRAMRWWFVLGWPAFIAVIGFPLWITFILFIGVSLNLMIFQGQRGLANVILAMLAGALVMVLASGLHFRPDTGPLSTGLCMLALTLYLFMFAHDAYARGVDLRQSRKQLNTRIAEITSLQSRLQEQASRDPLTGLYNRRHLNSLLEQGLAECRLAGTD